MVSNVESDLPRLHPPPPAWLSDLVVAALIFALAFAPFPGGEFRASTPLTWTLVMLPAVLLPFRRRWPLVLLAAMTLVYCVLLLLGVLSGGAVLAVGVAMFGVANRVSRRTGLVSMIVAEAAVIGASLLSSIGTAFDPRIVQVVLVIAFAGAAGDASKFRREYVQAVTDRAIRAEETKDAEARRRVSEERLRIARDLHDAVAHQISVISLNAAVASAALESRPEKAREALATIRAAARAVLGEIGDLMAVLRAGGDDGDGLSPQPDLTQLDQLIGSFDESSLDVVVRTEGMPVVLPASVSRIAYRVVQEGLTNALKHGAEHRAHVLLDGSDDALRVVVTNPVSPASGGPETIGGFGLVGLRERVASVRGSMAAGHTPGGFRLAATIPIPEEVSS